ncbi:MAG TPA: hypothetical protein VHF89_10780 [Solirubrobacteraceae bacterium]|nr:hypothetical protein [Solirubrobacteraceae bacterium]
MRATVQVAAAALVLAALATSAFAQDGRRAEMSMPFTSTTPAVQTGLSLDLRYLNPEDREGKPPTVSKLAIHLPAGTRLDPAALPACDASDDEIRARGRDACPPETLVGTGKLEVYLGGPGDPQTTDLALFNGPAQIIEIILFEGTNTTAAHERLRVDGETLRAEPAQVPPGAPPDRRFAASHITWDVPANGAYLTTPAACPADGWRTIGEFEFADGSSERTESAQRCERARGSDAPAAPRPAAGVRVAATPRTLVRGRRTRLRVRVRSSDPACVRGATVHVGTRSARTDDAGRATLTALVRYLARPKLRAHTPCGRAYATLVTLRAAR